MTDWIEIFSESLPVNQAIGFVADPLAGGIDLFLGTTRAEQSPAGQALLALEYEAYPEMALQQMKRLAEEARRDFAVVKCAILHRVGRVDVGEPSVAIAVSSPHRADAFAACRFLIDTLKRDVPIWKKEIWNDGGASWSSGFPRNTLV